MKASYRSRYVELNDVRLHLIEAGPGDGPLLILLHGFPEFWYGWRHQIDAFADAGFRVVVPDQRGYNLSDKPKEIAAYSLDKLAGDVIGLIEEAGADKARLVGHDWGAAVSWWTANRFPQKIHKLGILNVPHPTVMGRHLRQNAAQRRRSWYMFFFQIPWLPETLLRAGNCYGAVRLLQATGKPDTFSKADFDAYRRAWSRPRAMTSMINWYRAMMKVKTEKPADPRIHVPTLMLWGALDTALGVEMAQPSIDLCDQGTLVLFKDATHWVQHDAAQQVNAHLLEFLAE